MKKSKKADLDHTSVTKLELRKELRDLEARWERKFDEKLEENRKQTVSDIKAVEIRFGTRLEENRKNIVTDIKAAMEDRNHELQGAHQDELDAMAGKKGAPPQWRSMPRRLTVLEMDVEKIKDHLEIA